MNVFVTGSNTGVGLATVERFARAGHHVWATFRNPAKADALQALKAEGLPIDLLQLDVCDAGSVVVATDAALAAGPIDILVNNAGFEVVAPVEELTDALMLSQFDANVLGVVRVTRALLPAMRARGEGCVVSVSSVLGHTVFPHRAAYCASKHALEALTKAMWLELRPFGIRVANIVVGASATNFSANYVYADTFDETSPYWPYEAAMRASMRQSGGSGYAPNSSADVAEVIYEAATTATPRFEYLVGKDADVLVPGTRAQPLEAFSEAAYNFLGVDTGLLAAGPRPNTAPVETDA